MTPYITENNQPRVKLKIVSPSVKTIDGLIDTGFSGGLALSEKFLKYFSGQPIAFQEFELADGSLIDFAIYQTIVLAKSKRKVLSTIITKSDDNLVGIEFLHGLRFVVDLKNEKIELK